jgi:ankyrin repeat protein
VDARGYGGQTALMCAASSGRTAIVQQLLAAHANVNLKDYESNSALDLALEKHQDHMVRLLTQTGAR